MADQQQFQQIDAAPSRPGPTRELYKFNSDELRVLRECRTESFYFRCLPFGTAFGLLGYYAVQRGYLKGSAKYGPWPKVVMGVLAGYVAGKFSYQKKCAEKMMSLPNSPLGEALRKSRGKGLYNFQEGFTSEPINIGAQTAESDSTTFSDSLQELRAEDRSYDAPPTAAGLDDTFRPTLDSFVVEEQPLPPPTQNVTSYDDLRRRNRQEFEEKRAEAMRRVEPPRRPPVAETPSTSAYSSRSPSSPSSYEKKNAYGDVWED